MTPATTLPRVQKAFADQPITDMHTHLYPPTFGTPDGGASGQNDPNGLLLWGVEELLTYHYLVAEVYRVAPRPYEQFWKMSKTEQSDHIWKHLFIERSPVSEACRGVLTTLAKLGLDPADRNLNRIRKWFKQQKPNDYIDRVMQTANVSSITMTNPVFDDNERERWLKNPGVANDPRFTAVLRIDPMLRNWPAAAKKMSGWGYDVSEDISVKTTEEARRFLREWLDRQNAIYMAVSLPPEFRFPAPADNALAVAGQKILENVILPVAAERKLPFAMMIGCRQQVNPNLKDAGDMVGKSDINTVVDLCAAFPQNKFFVTMLARENQHELAVAARKFGNLMVFGCWWFLNNPSLIEETERMRFELLGTSFIPQHSDARVLDQLVYKWDHSRSILARVLADKYDDVIATGWTVSDDEIWRDVKHLLADNFKTFLAQ
ncbi:MAG TPA: hypothetical protein VF595_14990 [Tepidisphaeraceae bacterium]